MKSFNYILILLLIFFSGCKKFVQISPPYNQLVSDKVFANDATASATVNGIYSEMISNSQQFSSGFITLFTGMAADELYYYSASIRDEFVNNEITLANHGNLTSWFWAPAYKYIYTVNLCIEKLNESVAITPSLKNTLIGECKFLRAFSYFHLVNLFGDVPLTTSSDYRANAQLPRSSRSLIYQQIITDLKDAEALLNTNYPTSERVRANKWAAAALLARVYLYNQNWDNAETEATSVITCGAYSLETNVSNVFLKSSNESIWQLRTVSSNINTWEGNAILPASNASVPTFLLSTALLNAFEVGDSRKTNWVTSRVFAGQTLYYPYKYKVFGNNAPLTEYYVILRLAEQYLIRAESRAQLNNLSGAIADLNIIRIRAGLPTLLNSLTKAQVLDAVEKERKVELFAEWGNRWYDLKRTGRADAILGALKPTTWQATDVLWPIPQDQINLNQALIQNPGY
jgi:hypothetical protein